MSNLQNTKMSNKPKSNIASKIPTSGRDSGTHSRSSSVSNLTSASDLHSEIGDATSESTEDFKIDERVWVNGTKPGCIKFIGKTQFAPGVWAGVLLDESVGKNDGSVAGVKYFSCEPLKGIFARPSKLTRTCVASGIGDSAMVGSLTTPPRCSNVPSSRASVCSNVSSSSPKSIKLKIGDRITVSSLSGLKSGTLRFIGETDFAKGEWAGIELDEPTGKNDGSVAGKRYFTCQLKYGLFAPLHKVSRPGATPVSRPGSVRGTPLLRSNSRDSLNSSVSNSSRASRVKLGITSLTSAQKARVCGGMGVTSATKAFEVGAKSAELEKKQKLEESVKKSLEEQLAALQKKFEDIQFQLEEEKIAKTDFETQLLQRSQILKHIEEYISKESGEKFLNIREILSGQEKLSEIGDTQIASEDSTQLLKRIAELEDTVKLLSKEKNEVLNQLTELQKCSAENTIKNDSLVGSLNATVQEKDDMITNLKNELNSNIEKVTCLIEDNKNLSEQILLKEEQAKGHADDVIKELGEKINSLREQLKTQSSQLTENVTSIEEKDNKIKTLECTLKEQSDALLLLQNEHKHVSDALKLKESQYEEKIDAQKSLEETMSALKCQLETHNSENQKKINLLEDEIKNKSGLLNNYLSSIEEKENLISSLQQNFNSQEASLLQLENEKKKLTESLNKKDVELGERTAKQKLLEEQITALTAQIESNVSDTEKKMLDLVKEIERLTNCVQEKEDDLLKTQNELSTSQSTIEELNATVQQLSEKIQQADLSVATTNQEAVEKINSLQNELNALMQEKSDIKSEYEKEISALKTAIKIQEDEIQVKSDILAKLESEISLLTEKLNKSTDECSALKKESEELAVKNKDTIKEKEIIETLLKEKDGVIADFTKEVEILKKSFDKSNYNLEMNSKELESLRVSLNAKEEENNQLTSKLQLAEQKVEMLNKDSSDHVMTLQNELSKLKEESTTTKTHLEQELSKVKNENEKLTDVIKEKESSLLEKEEIVISLEKKLKESDSKLSDLSAQNTDIMQTVSKCNADIEKAKKQEEELSRSVSDFERKLSEKEQELLDIKNSNEKLSVTITEKEKTLIEKEEIITSLQNKLKDGETIISDLSAQNADLLKNISKFSMNIEEGQKEYNEKLSSATIEYENKLKEKDQVIQDIQNELKKNTELLENKTKELDRKDSEVSALKTVIQEKESQFDELGKMVESSQNQLALLKEQNEKNETLLQSKESFIADFKTEQEKQLQLKEQSFKEENLKLQNLIQSKNEEINSKETCISNLSKELEDKKKFIDALQAELETIKNDQKKVSDDSKNIYQELNNRIMEMEEKYSKLLEEKEKIAKEELQTRNAKKNLEVVRDTLLQEKSAQEEMVKDKEAKLEALQAEVNRMQTEFAQHKRELQQKLDVSEVELQAALELKNQLDIQHNVLEELQQELHNSDEKCKMLEAQVQMIPLLTSEKNQLQTMVDEFQKLNKEKSEMFTKMEEKCLTLEEQLNNNKNLMKQKEKELSGLKEQLQKLPSNKVPSNLSLKSLEDENVALKNKITLLELEKKPDEPIAKTSTKKLSPELEEEEREFLNSQIDFLNSIIVDLKQKNEKLTEQLEAQTTCWEEGDVNFVKEREKLALQKSIQSYMPNLKCGRFTQQVLRDINISGIIQQAGFHSIEHLHKTNELHRLRCLIHLKLSLWNETKKAIAPRLFCDICEVFDLHETDDCPKQESFADEDVPQLRRAGTRQLEERPYCNNCEVFGHWTLDCEEPETF